METLPDALEYIRTRYKNPDQRLVNLREIKLVCNLFSRFLSPDSLILDIPCGYGRLTAPLTVKGFRVIGGDISPAMVKIVKLELKIPAVNLSIFDLPFRDGAFDAVLTWRLFHHFDFNQVEKALREIARVARDFVIFSFYRENVLHKIERKLVGLKSGIRFYRVERIRHLLAKMELKPVLIKPLFGPFHAQTVCVAKH